MRVSLFKTTDHDFDLTCNISFQDYSKISHDPNRPLIPSPKSEKYSPILSVSAPPRTQTQIVNLQLCGTSIMF